MSILSGERRFWMCLNSSTHSEFSSKSMFPLGGTSLRCFIPSGKGCFFFLRRLQIDGYNLSTIEKAEGNLLEIFGLNFHVWRISSSVALFMFFPVLGSCFSESCDSNLGS